MVLSSPVRAEDGCSWRGLTAVEWTAGRDKTPLLGLRCRPHGHRGPQEAVNRCGATMDRTDAEVKNASGIGLGPGDAPRA